MTKIVIPPIELPSLRKTVLVGFVLICLVAFILSIYNVTNEPSIEKDPDKFSFVLAASTEPILSRSVADERGAYRLIPETLDEDDPEYEKFSEFRQLMERGEQIPFYVDGVLVQVGDEILLKDEVNTQKNGTYRLEDGYRLVSTSQVRAESATGRFSNFSVFIREGKSFKNCVFVSNFSSDRLALDFKVQGSLVDRENAYFSIVGATASTITFGNPPTVTLSGTNREQTIHFGIPAGRAATLAAGTVTTSAPGSNAVVTNVGTASDAILNFTIPRGDPGTAVIADVTVSALAWDDDPTVIYTGPPTSRSIALGLPVGRPATVTAGTVTTGAAGSSAIVTNVGTTTDAIFDFTIPKGDQGDSAAITGASASTVAYGNNPTVTLGGTSMSRTFAFGIPAGRPATVAVGSVSTGAPGSSANVTNAGTVNDAVLNFAIPQGQPGVDAVISGASASTLSFGTSPTVTLGGTAGNRTFAFGIPAGRPATVAVGTVTEGASASVTNVGTVNDAVLDVVLPRGSDAVISGASVSSVAWNASPAVTLGGTPGNRTFAFDLPVGRPATVGVGTVVSGPVGVTNAGTSNDAIFNFSIPPGASAAISSATAVGLAPGSSPTVTLGGTSLNRTFEFGIPAGATGAAGASATISSATAVGLAAGASPTVTLGGTSLNRTFEFGIPAGATGATGAAGASAAISSATAVGLAAGSSPTVTLGGTSLNRTFEFGIPAGATGAAGASAIISGASASSLTYGTAPTVTLGGTSLNRTFAFGIPEGRPATVSVGSVMSGPTPSVTNVGTVNDALLNFVFPRGDDGSSAVISGASATSVAYNLPPTVTLGGTPLDRTFAFEIPAGRNATVSVGAVTEGPTASVTNVGTENDAIFDFVLRRGNDAVISSATAVGLASGASPTVTLGGTPGNRTFEFGIPAGQAASISSATAVGLSAGASPTVTLGGTSTNRTFQFGIPAGAAASVAVGSVSSSTTPSVTNSGTSSAAILDFVLPEVKVQAGTTTTGAPGTNASVSASTVGSTTTFSFTIPRGEPGTVYRELQVSKSPASGQFSSIAAALASITDNSITNRYKIYVGPGVYTEPAIVLKPYVVIQGANTIIQPAANNHHVVSMSANSVMGFVTVRGAGLGYAGVYLEDCGDYCHIHKVLIMDCSRGIWVKTTSLASSLHLEHVRIETTSSFANLQHLVLAEAAAGYELTVHVENYDSIQRVNSFSGSQHKVVGADAYLYMRTFHVVDLSASTAVEVENGSHVVLSNGKIDNQAGIGVRVNNTGSTPSLIMSASIFEDTVGTLISILNPNTSGYFQGTASKERCDIHPDSSFFINNTDARIVTVAKKGGDFVTISDAIDYANTQTVTESNPLVIQVGPGTYTEPELVLPAYVSLRGASIMSTIIQPDTALHHICRMNQMSEMSFLSLQGAGVNYAAVACIDSGDFTQLHKVSIFDSFIGILLSSTSALNASEMYLEYVDVNSDTVLVEDDRRALVVTSSAGTVFMNAENFYTFFDDFDGHQIEVNGAGSTLKIRSFGLSGNGITASPTPANAKGIRLINGGQAFVQAGDFLNFDTAIWCDNSAGSPQLQVTSVTFDNCTTNLNIDNASASGYFTGYTEYAKTIIHPSSSFFLTSADRQIVSVAKKGANFTSVAAALASVTGTSTTQYTIEVGPGVYSEPQLVLKPYVNIRGKGVGVTVLQPTNPAVSLLVAHDDSEVSDLTIRGVSSATEAAVYYESNSTGVETIFLMKQIEFGANHTHVHVHASGTNDSLLKMFNIYMGSASAFTRGIRMTSTSGRISELIVQDLLINSLAATYPTTIFQVVNTGSLVKVLNSSISSSIADPSVDQVSAIQVTDGGAIHLSGVYLNGFYKGLEVTNTGASPRFLATELTFERCTYDIHNSHPTCQGTFTGVGSHTKIVNNSPDISWAFHDRDDYEFEITNRISMTYTDNNQEHVDLSTLLLKGSPMGLLAGGVITAGTGRTIQVSAGMGYLETSANNGLIRKLEWGNLTSSTLAASTEFYVFISENNVLSFSGTMPETMNSILLGRIMTSATGIEWIDSSPSNAVHATNRLSQFVRDGLGAVYVSGSLVTEHTTARQLVVSSGKYYFADKLFQPSGMTGGNFKQYRSNGTGGWTISTTNTVTNSQYDNGSGTLASLTSTYYTKHSLYLIGEGSNEQYFLVVGQAQYATLVEAEGASLPAPPSSFQDGITLIAVIYVRQGSANLVRIEDARPVIGFKALGVNASSTHGNLLGLSADDHPQYFRADGARAMTGNVNFNSNKGVNLTSVINPSLEEYKIQLASGTEAGFMSSTDKSKLNSFATEASYFLADGSRAMSGSLTGVGNITTSSGTSRALTLNGSSTNTIDLTSATASALNMTAGVVTGVTSINTIPAALATALANGFMSSTDKSKLDTFGTETTYLLRDGTRAMTGSLSLGTNAITNVTTLNGITMTPSGNPVAVGSANSAGVATTYARLDHVHDHGNQAGGLLHAAATSSVNGFMSSADKTKLDTFGTETTYLLRDGTRAMTGALSLGTNAITNVTTLNGITMTPTGNPSSVGSANSAGVATTYARLDHVHDHGNQAGGLLHAAATSSVNGFMSSTDKSKLDTFGTESTYLLRDGTRAMTGSLSMGTNALTNVTTINSIAAALATSVASGFMSSADKAKLDGFGTETTYLLRDGTRAMTGGLDLGTNAVTNVTTLNGITMTPSGNPVAVGTANAAGVATTYARLDHVHDHGNQAGGLLHAAATTSTAGFMSSADKTKIDSFGTETTYLLRDGTRAMTGGLNMGTNALTNVTTINAIPASLATSGANGFMSSTDKTKLDTFGTETTYLLRDGTRAMTGSLDLGTNAVTNVTTLNGITMTPSGNPVALGSSNAAGTATTYARLDHVHSHGDQAGGSLHAVATTSVAGFMSAADKTKLDGLGADTNYVLRDGTRAMTGSLNLGTNALTNVTTINSIPAALATISASGFMSASDKVKLDGITPNASFESVSQNINDYAKAFAYSGGNLTTITYTKGLATIVKTFNYSGGNLVSMVLSGDTPSGIPLTKTFTYTGSDLTGISYS